MSLIVADGYGIYSLVSIHSKYPCIDICPSYSTSDIISVQNGVQEGRIRPRDGQVGEGAGCRGRREVEGGEVGGIPPVQGPNGKTLDISYINSNVVVLTNGS